MNENQVLMVYRVEVYTDILLYTKKQCSKNLSSTKTEGTYSIYMRKNLYPRTVSVGRDL